MVEAKEGSLPYRDFFFRKRMVEVNEEFQFPLARKIAPEETVEVLIVQVKKTGN